jgi:ribA/ribD-fused uncharacterized protein
MTEKMALLFEDEATASKIRGEVHGVTVAHKLGRQVKGFQQDVWGREKQNIMVEGIYYKFRRNCALRAKLIETGDRDLVAIPPWTEYEGWGTLQRAEARHQR